MKDIQSLQDTRRIDIRKVGVKNISYPITVLDKAKKTQKTVASVNMYVNLPHMFKGTHMSRFIEILNQFHGRFNIETLHPILAEMRSHLNAEKAHFEITFPYFFKSAIDSRQNQPQRYNCMMHGSLRHELDLIVEVNVPVSLQMSEKEISGIWGNVTVSVRLKHFLWLEDLITQIEKGIASTNGANNSAIGNVCKNIGAVLTELNAFSWYKVAVENISSGYTTTASLEGP